jgi:hypothetical protein
MQFLLSVLTASFELGTPEEYEAVGVFNQGLRDRGQFVYANGLELPSQAVVIDNRAGLNQVNGAEYAEGEEFLAGFWIIDVDSKEEAQAIALEGSRACNRRVELRAFHQ